MVEPKASGASARAVSRASRSAAQSADLDGHR